MRVTCTSPVLNCKLSQAHPDTRPPGTTHLCRHTRKIHLQQLHIESVQLLEGQSVVPLLWYEKLIHKVIHRDSQICAQRAQFIRFALSPVCPLSCLPHSLSQPCFSFACCNLPHSISLASTPSTVCSISLTLSSSLSPSFSDPISSTQPVNFPSNVSLSNSEPS